MRKILLVLIGCSLLFAELTRENGVVSDSVSHLDWQDDYSDNGGVAKSASWEEAIVYCEALSLNGDEDWHLPNINELKSIIDISRSSPAMDPLFESITSSYVWSATTSAGGTDVAWYVDFGSGSALNDYYFAKSGSHQVRCVRGRQ